MLQDSRSEDQEYSLAGRHIMQDLLPFKRNQGFIDRPATFERLDKVNFRSGNRCAAIWGLGGSDKTQMALGYAFRHKKEKWSSIFWIHGSSESAFHLRLSQTRQEGQPQRQIRIDRGDAVCTEDWIEQQRNWILIVDNADDLTPFKRHH